MSITKTITVYTVTAKINEDNEQVVSFATRKQANTAIETLEQFGIVAELEADKREFVIDLSTENEESTEEQE